jgi:hypothetical protein
MISRIWQSRPSLEEQEPLAEVASHLLEECRMVLPGIQALFGFQLIAVFNAKFWELASSDRMIHLFAITLVAVAIALVMTPAAYHRQVHQNCISRKFIEMSSQLLLFSMFPLMLGICLDFYLIANMILANGGISLAITIVLAAIFIGLWIVLPRLARAAR